MILPSFWPMKMGGSEIQAFRLAREFSGKGVQVVLFVGADTGLPGEEVKDGIKVHRIYTWWDRMAAFFKKKADVSPKDVAAQPVRIEYDNNVTNYRINTKMSPAVLVKSFFFLMSAWWLVLTRYRKVDVIHAHMVEWVAVVSVCLGRLTGAKVLVKDSTINGIGYLQRYPLGRWLQKSVINGAYFVAISSAIRNAFLEAGVQPERIVNIYNGVDIPPETGAEKPFGYICLFVGNLYQQPAKGVDVLIRAWKAVQEQYPESRLHILGDGPLEAYRAYIRDKGLDRSIQLIGKSNEVKKYMLESDIFILPSRREGLSNVLLEAMSMGLPCVATRISGSEDLISDSKNGLLVSPDDVTGLANAINRMLGDPEAAAAMGAQARQTAKEKFDLKIVADQYLDFYNEVI